jgi:hypothetical protein
MKKLLIDLFLSLEQENTSGIINDEKEYVFYAKLKDLSILKSAISVEEQEQWTIKIPKTSENLTKGTMRVRETVKDGVTTYALTVKTPLNDAQGVFSQNNTSASTGMQKMREVAIDATEGTFELFKLMANSGMKKIRYTLPIEDNDCVFEVDCFLTPNGKYSEWVKIDLEVKEPLSDIPELPECFTDVIYNQEGSKTPEENELITRLYDEVFLIKRDNV